MGQGRFSLLFLVLAACLALVVTAPAGASTPCSKRLLADWGDGRIDGTYPVHCYREALADLPEDVRVYSSAPDDITRALDSQVRKLSAREASPAGADGGGGGTSPLLVVAICSAALLALSSAAAILR